jgi:hypothetical protein
MGFALFLGACNGLDCGEGRERTFSGIRESSVVYWRERYLIGNKPETVEHNVCMQLCYEASPDAIPRFGDCRDLQLDGGTAGAPGTGGGDERGRIERRWGCLWSNSGRRRADLFGGVHHGTDRRLWEVDSVVPEAGQ